uniref:Uncharacterized protein n=1 Tax=Tanacetum cinerariifolium TaxID=118510 RepID=A0A6L2JWB9_TANCI|nr:hypothetical protein [Tanacetum cinerariifolium]
MKAEKTRILDEKMAKRLQDEEIEQAVVREKQEKENLERDKVLQQQYDQKQENIDWNVIAKQMQEKHLDNIRKYKIAHFKGMTYDQVRPIFEREYNKVQTFLKPNRDEEPAKKRDAEETLLQDSFKKLRAEVEALGLQVEEDSKVARDLVMKIFLKANQLKTLELMLFKTSRKYTKGLQLVVEVLVLLVQDVPLGGEMDELLENLIFDDEEELHVFMDDDEDVWDEDKEWLMAPVTSPRATVTVSGTYEVGEPAELQIETRVQQVESRVDTYPSVQMYKLLTVASLIFWQWQQPSLAVGTYTASGNSNMAVGTPYAFYSQE